MSFLRKPSDPHTVPSVFPTFLLPSIPFRRKSRQSSTDSTDSNNSASSTSSNPFIAAPTPADPSTGPVLPPEGKFLNGHTSHLRCSKCSTDLCLTSQIISKGFTGRHGRAYLVQGQPSHTHIHSTGLPNTYQNKAVPRNLVTGQHTVSDVSCAICGTVLGWKYVEAAEESQKYKVGKFILETKRIKLGVSWENGDDEDESLPIPPNELNNAEWDEEEAEFDSQDEDECEDLFAGVWSTQLALKRRRGKRFGRGGGGITGLRARSEEML
jgi:hypothetical protein